MKICMLLISFSSISVKRQPYQRRPHQSINQFDVNQSINATEPTISINQSINQSDQSIHVNQCNQCNQSIGINQSINQSINQPSFDQPTATNHFQPIFFWTNHGKIGTIHWMRSGIVKYKYRQSTNKSWCFIHEDNFQGFIGLSVSEWNNLINQSVRDQCNSDFFKSKQC